ncbi:Legumain [Tritrichomonas foetus]|uniref:Legumain n=1 Tax=Tritrichomonas foetus TaxID=1144522 RepID=A0A1J4K112_9EUKA|nr:Legumain [Tritrichomonas foetus]|eukprot:OHT04923.1 Legumain [Tritrichomonas foetus]
MLSFAFISLALCENWAVIFTGSNTWSNYRHSADSFYQFKLLLEGGIPRDHIILMNYDDTARIKRNPFQNKIFRDLDHLYDIYPGQESMNYSQTDVNKENFLNVLKGNSTNGPALKSTIDDNVFIFYDNHGGSGILGVPDKCGDFIYADELIETFQYMSDHKMFKKLFFPITACYAGSVAMYLEDIPNMYIMTASNAVESSYADLFDIRLGAYLTSEFSFHKDEFIETYPTGTLADLFDFASENVRQSSVCEFGDMSLKTMTIDQFVGPRSPKSKSKTFESKQKIEETKAKIDQLQKSIEVENNEVLKAEMELRITAEKMCEARLDQIISGLKKKFELESKNIDFTKNCKITNWTGYRKVMNALKENVEVIGDAFYAKTFFFSNLCSIVDADEIVAEIKRL